MIIMIAGIITEIWLVSLNTWIILSDKSLDWQTMSRIILSNRCSMLLCQWCASAVKFLDKKKQEAKKNRRIRNEAINEMNGNKKIVLTESPLYVCVSLFNSLYLRLMVLSKKCSNYFLIIWFYARIFYITQYNWFLSMVPI